MNSALPHPFKTCIALIISSAAIIGSRAHSQETASKLSQGELEFFEKKIRPVLAEHCYKCHASDSEKIKGGLLLDSREATLRGGDTGHAVVPGNLNESLLYTAVTYEDSDLEMPPKYPLSKAEVADIKKWIEMGAPDPRNEKREPGKKAQSYVNTINPEEGRDFWAYQKPTKHALPEIKQTDWPKNEIDYFILARLEAEGMSPSADTDARTLLRRIYFDLIGLPPKPVSVEAFVKAYETDPEAALAEAADRLLESKQFGERWGRHWLDVARYAESSGKETNAIYPHAWRYRNYVIDSFNDDKPYDQFIQEQIAGDLMEARDDRHRAELQVATGFLALGTKSLNSPSPRVFRFDLVDEQIDTATRSVLATSVACARCHDHKFDPISMQDYYAMAGIFLSSETHFGTVGNAQNRNDSDLIQLAAPDPNPIGETYSLGEMIDMDVALHTMREQRQEAVEQLRESRRNGTDAGNAQRQALVLQTRIGLLEARIASLDDNGVPIPLAMGVTDSEEPFHAQILLRGEEDNGVERAKRGFVKAIYTGDEEQIPEDQSGRLQLAHWMTTPENPLTGRVMGNRVWYWLFGQGIVPTLDNFGSTGQQPTHPELLDHLSIRFAEHEWSVKKLVREIVLSRSYRMSSDFNEEYFQKDPDNQLFWRANKRRLDAESIRDSILFVSGQLDLTQPTGSVVANSGEGFVGRINSAQLKTDEPIRSVYLPIVRDLLPDVLNLFDFADPSMVKGKRDVTTVPSQALYLMNSEFVNRQAEAMARHLIEDQKLRGSKLGLTAFYTSYSRPPTPEEGRKTSAYFERFIKTAMETGSTQEEARYLALTTFCQALFSSAEFRYLN